MYRALHAGKTYAGPVAEFPESERRFLASLSICSMLAAPIHVQNNLWGIIAFDDCSPPRTWSVHEEALIAVIAGSLGVLLARRDSERLVNARDRLLRGVA